MGSQTSVYNNNHRLIIYAYSKAYPMPTELEILLSLRPQNLHVK